MIAKQSSLAGALYRRVVLLLAVVGLVMAAILYVVAQREVHNAADRQIMNASQMLYILMREELVAGTAAPATSTRPAIVRPLLSAEDREAFRTNLDTGMFVVFRNGSPVLRSLQGAATGVVPARAGFHDFQAPDGEWRSFGLSVPEHGLLIVVAERHAVRDLAFIPIARKLALPLVLMIAGSAVLLWLSLRRGLSEIRRLGSDLSARTLADLTPLDRKEWPRDLAPLVLSLNKLFVRLDQAFELEQAFTDDVAHQVRTPLAAIRAQAQLLRKMAPHDLRPEADQLIAAVDRANGLVSGMLTLARLDATAIERTPLDARELVADLVAEQMLQQPAGSIAFSVTPDSPVPFVTDAALLKIILSAVIENAVRHAGDGRHIEIVLGMIGGELRVTVADHGPGVPSRDRERLLRRFERGPTEATGSGLGLSIAARAASILGGAILLGDRPEGPGLLVTIRVPAKI